VLVGRRVQIRVFALLKGSREAMRDRRFRYQLKDSASGPPKHITEGFVRFSPRDFCRFLDYALGSLREAESWIQDGIEFGDSQEEQCRRAFWFKERCFTATLRLKHSQERYAEQLERERRARSNLKKADRQESGSSDPPYPSYRLMPAREFRPALPESPLEGSRRPTFPYGRSPRILGQSPTRASPTSLRLVVVKVQWIAQVLQLPVVIERGRAVSRESQLPEELDFLRSRIATERSILQEGLEPWLVFD
jgi:four helix bundle protein